MVVFDASVMIDLFDPRLKGEAKQRIQILIASLGKEKVVIPAPAYIEFLTRADRAREEYHASIEASSTFRVEPLSTRAAIECAILLDGVFSKKQKTSVTRTKLKFDWMIIAIAKTLAPRLVYSHDDDIVKACKHAGLASVCVSRIVIPPPTPMTPDLFTPSSEGGGL